MISIKNNLLIQQPHFTGERTDKIDANVMDYHERQTSTIPDSYGKALIKKHEENKELRELERFEKTLSETSNSDKISLKDAVNELNSLNLSSKRATDIILACTFENDNPEITINKKALLITKETMLYDGKLPAKYTDAIRGCLDEDTETFNLKKFDSMFNARGEVKITARTKSNPTNYEKTLRETKRAKRLKIQQYVEQNYVQTKRKDFKTSMFFSPLEEQTKPIIDGINNNKDFPDALKDNMKDAVNNGDFDLKNVYTNYYSLLDDCKTLDDVKELYPELKYPDKKPEYQKSAGPRVLSNRLAKENFDNVIITTLKKLHKNLQTPNGMYIEFENSPATTWQCMKNAGYEFSTPSKETLSLLKKGEDLKSAYENMPEYTEDEIKQIANKHSIRTSHVWNDYHELTSKNWMPVRLIKHKRLNPETSKYSTNKLVNSYLYNLYQTNKNGEYSSNPLEKLDEIGYANKDVKNVINRTYWTRFKDEDENAKYSNNFKEFKKQFDKESIGKSLEKLEDNYTKAFFSLYWTPERVDNLKKDMQTSYDLIYEKVILKEQMQPKVVTNNDVKELIEDNLSMEVPEKIEDDKLSKFKYRVSTIRDKELKQRCLSSINDGENSDLGYFNTINDIIEKSTEDDYIDEDKASVLINLHDKYLNSIITNNNTQSEDEFVIAQLEQYQQPNGDIDYEKANKETKVEAKYFSKYAQMEQEGENEINSLIEDKFIFDDNENYEDATKILEYYGDIPKTFKDKYTTILKKSSKLDNDNFMQIATELHDKISSWNYDNDEEIIMDKDKIPQKVVITHNAKKDLLNAVHGNLELFDSYLNKFYSAAQTRTGNKGGQGIKTVPGSGYDAEIKIMGAGGDIRMYTRSISPEDKWKYSQTDNINVKYIFDTCGEHL